MTKQSDIKQNEIKPATNELSEQDLNKVAGGAGPVDGARLPFQPVDGLKPVGPVDGARLPLGPVDGRK
jgi:hypothetical protein